MRSGWWSIAAFVHLAGLAETDRHITEAGQGLAYTFGMLKILDLRARAEARLGARFDLKAFHEAVLQNGPLPLDLLEQEVMAWLNSRLP